MNKRLLLVILITSISILLLSCSASNSAGGSDLPNGKVSASIIIPEESNTPITVSLIETKLDSINEQITFEEVIQINSSQTVEFNNIPEGLYILKAISNDKKDYSVRSKILLDFDTLVIVDTFNLSHSTILKGRVTNATNCKVIVPGTKITATTDSDGFYVLNDVPSGIYELGFIINNILSFITIKTKDVEKNDTVFIQDIDIITDTIVESFQHNLYKHSFLTSNYVTPKEYSFDNKPDWYNGKDFTKITYFKIDTLAAVQKPIWHFPIIAGITKATLNYYGGIGSITDSIKTHIKKLDSLFNIDGLEGDIKYTLDSIYIIEMHPDSEVVEPPEGFAVRLLYDGFQESTRGNWIKKDRVIIHNSSSENVGTFSAEAMKAFMWEFGLFRGCSYISATEIYASQNKVNGTAFNAPSTVMNLKSTTEWIDANIYIMNHSEDRFSIIPAITLNAFPAVIGIKVLDYDNYPIENIQINVYGVEDFPDSLDNIIDYSGTTNKNGLFTFSENPYVTADHLQHIYDNLLIEIIDGNNKIYRWLPQFKMYEWWFEHPGEEFYLTINIL